MGDWKTCWLHSDSIVGQVGTQFELQVVCSPSHASQAVPGNTTGQGWVLHTLCSV